MYPFGNISTLNSQFRKVSSTYPVRDRITGKVEHKPIASNLARFYPAMTDRTVVHQDKKVYRYDSKGVVHFMGYWE
jgi:hypothetical protein